MNRLLVILVSIFIISCTRNNDNIKVAVASNAQYAIEEIKIAFEDEFQRPVEIVIGSSGKLTAQIREGAPYDLFLSADMQYAEALFNENLTLKKPEVYAFGEVVLWFADTAYHFVDQLTHTSVKKIAVANPETAPYGEAGIEALHFYKLYERVKTKLVFGESVSQATQYVLSGAAEAGFTAKSVVIGADLKDKGRWIEIDPKGYMPIAQGVVILSNGKKDLRKEAVQFHDFLFSESAKRIFQQYGYKVP